MQGTQTFQNFANRVVAVLVVAACAAFLISLITSPRPLAQLGPALVTIGYLAYVMLWRPYVEVSQSHVVFHNVFVTVQIPWPAISGISTRWALTVTSGGKEYSAWALAATATGRQPRLVQGPDKHSHAFTVGALLETRFKELSHAGHLSSPAARALAASVTIDKPTVAIVSAGVVLSVLAFLVF